MAASVSEADLPPQTEADQEKQKNLICMMKITGLKAKHGELNYYEGKISVRNHEDPVEWPKARINAYRRNAEEQCLAMRKTQHSCLMRANFCAASASGSTKYIAFPPFDCTLQEYLDTSSTIFNGLNCAYFSTDFQGLLRDIVNGLDALDKFGMSYQTLNPRDIFLVKYNYKAGRKIFARLANYNEKKLGQDNWKNLGIMVETIFKTYGNFEGKEHEILHLCEKLKNGSLQGSKVLDHPTFWSLEKRRQFLNKLNAQLQQKSSTSNIDIEDMYEKIFDSTDLWTEKLEKGILKAVLTKGGAEGGNEGSTHSGTKGRAEGGTQSCTKDETESGTKGGISATVKEFVRFLRNLCINASDFAVDLIEADTDIQEPDWCIRAAYPLIFIELQDAAQYL